MLGALEKMLGFPDVVRESIGHTTVPNLVERVFADRPAPNAAFIQIDVEQPCHGGRGSHVSRSIANVA